MHSLCDDPSCFADLSAKATDDGGIAIQGERYTLTPDSDGSLRIDGTGPCGTPFPDVGRILDPASANPALSLRAPLGLCGVAQILRSVLCWQLMMEAREGGPQ